MIDIVGIEFNFGRQVKSNKDTYFINGTTWRKENVLGTINGINKYNLIIITPTEFAYSIWHYLVGSDTLYFRCDELNYADNEMSKEEIKILINKLEL